MKELKEITVFSIGDSTKLNSWSNVPYFFSKNLEAKGLVVNRVNIEENKTLHLLYRYTIFTLLKLVYKNSNHTFFRSGLNTFLTNLKINKAVKKYNKTDTFIFLTYSFSSKKYSPKKVILFGDWTYLYYIKKLLNREPYWFEKNVLKREQENIEQTNMSINLFPISLEFNKKNYNQKNQFYLGNVINANYPMDIECLTKQKINSKKLLFIGTKKYLQDALNLIDVFRDLIVKDNTIELHIIGLTNSEVKINLPNLFCYGYLNKSVITENELYYKLVYNAKVIINTNKNWGSFSAMTEAMYFHTPVITSPYQEFVETYGKEIDFGYYVDALGNDLFTKIELLINLPHQNYLDMMKAANTKVKEFTWSNYIDKFIELLSKQ